MWIYDWKRDTMTRLTFGPRQVSGVVWRPDGQHLFYREDDDLFWIRANGAGKPEHLAKGRPREYPSSFTPDGKWLAWGNVIAPVEGESEHWRLGKLDRILNSQAPNAAFSPDGHWLAYSSSESGRYEVYVRTFPGAGGKWQISNAGGALPVWSRTGRELFFRTVDESKIMVAAYETKGDAFAPGKPRLWSETAFTSIGPAPNFDLAPDGKRFAVLLSAEKLGDQKPRSELTVLLNFFTEVRRRAQ